MGRVEVERGELAACCCSYVFLVRHRDVCPQVRGTKLLPTRRVLDTSPSHALTTTLQHFVSGKIAQSVSRGHPPPQNGPLPVWKGERKKAGFSSSSRTKPRSESVEAEGVGRCDDDEEQSWLSSSRSSQIIPGTFRFDRRRRPDRTMTTGTGGCVAAAECGWGVDLE